MKIRDLMTRPPLALGEADDVALAGQVMAWGEVRHLPIVRGGRVVGVVSERDILAHQGEKIPVGEVMSAPPEVAHPDDDLAEAARRMVRARVDCLPVVEDDALVGIVTSTDLVRDRARHSRDLDLEDHASVGGVMTREPITAAPDEPLLDAAARMSERHVRHLPVVDVENRVLGMLSDRDVRTALGTSVRRGTDRLVPPRLQRLDVASAMTRGPITCRPDTDLLEVASILVDYRIGALPVVDEERHLIGIISYVDVLAQLAGRQLQ